MNDSWETRRSLLMRAKDASDEQAWKEFVQFYEGFIYHILVRMKIGSADRDDLLQEILIRLWKNLDSYESERARFRTWLGRIVHNAALDHFAAQKRQGRLVENEVENASEISLSSESEVEQLVESEWTLYLTSFALERLRTIFSGKAVEVFLMSLDGAAVDEIAIQLELPKDSVYTLKNRVKSRLIKEVNALIERVENP